MQKWLWEGKLAFSKSGSDETGQEGRGLTLHVLYISSFKLGHRLECKMYNYKHFIKRTRRNPQALRLNDEFLDLTPKPLPYKENSIHWTSSKSKTFCSVKVHVKRMKRWATDGEEVLANPACDKGPVSRIQKELSKLNSKKNQCKQKMSTKHSDISRKNIHTWQASTREQ